MSKNPQSVSPKINKIEEEDDEGGDDDEENGPTLKKQFELFVQWKNEEDPGTHILLSQSDFWMRHAGVIKGRILTQTDTGVCYYKFKKSKLSYEEYLEFLQMLANYKNIPVEDIINKLVNCGPPPEASKTVGPVGVPKMA